MAPPLKGCRAQGQLNANLIVGKFSIDAILLCDDFTIVHSLIRKLGRNLVLLGQLYITI